jgi:hypothetical protein
MAQEIREVDVLVGDEVCTISEEDARWLIERLRETYTDAEGREENPPSCSLGRSSSRSKAATSRSRSASRTSFPSFASSRRPTRSRARAWGNCATRFFACDSEAPNRFARRPTSRAAKHRWAAHGEGRSEHPRAPAAYPLARTARIMAKAPDPVRRSGRVTGPASLLKRGPRGSGEDRLDTASPGRRRLLSRLGVSRQGGYLELGRTSGTATGNRRSATLGSSHCGGSTLSGTRSPPSLSVPASRLLARWERASE